MLKSTAVFLHYHKCYAVFVVREETLSIITFLLHLSFIKKAKYLFCKGLRIQHGCHFKCSCLFKPLPASQPIREEMLWKSLRATLMKRERDDWKQGFMRGSDKWGSQRRTGRDEEQRERVKDWWLHVDRETHQSYSGRWLCSASPIYPRPLPSSSLHLTSSPSRSLHFMCVNVS